MAKIYNSWYWVSPDRGRVEWLQLKKYAQKRYGYNKKPLSGIFGGAVLSRKFLQRYAKIEIPSLCNDEVRLPLFAQAFHLPVYDTKLGKGFFTTINKTFSPLDVYRYYKKGIKAFHPVKESLNLNKILRIRSQLNKFNQRR